MDLPYRMTYEQFMREHDRDPDEHRALFERACREGVPVRNTVWKKPSDFLESNRRDDPPQYITSHLRLWWNLEVVRALRDFLAGWVAPGGQEPKQENLVLLRRRMNNPGTLRQLLETIANRESRLHGRRRAPGGLALHPLLDDPLLLHAQDLLAKPGTTSAEQFVDQLAGAMAGHEVLVALYQSPQT
ncbi:MULTISPECIES: hypothetical protein [Actinosynnema]|uniref:hypothetical protein n=1 Tax=Actinosynnema TaxID=40566 RepID=UPI0020A2A5D4|nr:hypothetical protein [Actinosynnema pretiosum]MCP2097355.1 hypothetical protein [Actinosynnema pretiosum]